MVQRWSGNAGWAVGTPGDELWGRIRSATTARNRAEQGVMNGANPTSYEALKAAAGRAVVAGGQAFANNMFQPADEYRDPSGRRISYEAYLRLHGYLKG